MKNLLTLLFTLFLSVLSMAQVTQGINFQAVARNASNNIVANQAIGLRLSITTGSEIKDGMALFRSGEMSKYQMSRHFCRQVSSTQLGLFSSSFRSMPNALTA